MQSDDYLPLDAWASALAAARAEQGLSIVETARELMLSPAQLRDIESGSMNAFHGSGYYFRAVKKYAVKLGVVLDPAVDSLPLTDSQLGMQRLSQSPKSSTISATATLSRRQSKLDHGPTVAPYRSRSSRIGMVLGVILLFAVALGVYLSVEEGWPNKPTTQTADKEPPALPLDVATESVAVRVEPKTTQTASPTLATPVQTQAQTPSPDSAVVPASESAAIESAATESAVSEPFSAPTLAPDWDTTAAPVAEPASVPVLETVPEIIPESPLPAPVDTIEARFTDDCWVEIRYKDGRVEQKIYTDRDILTVPIQEVAGLVFGNAQAVKAQRGDQSFDVVAFAGGRNVARISQADLQ